MTIRILLSLLSCSMVVQSVARAQTSSIVVDAASPEAPMRHGATGWLYGLAAPNVPTESIIAPLSPGIAAQKAPDGLQHPAGDALLVAPGYRAAGGREIQIYVQDIYPDWPYNQLGMDDFVTRLKHMAEQVERSGDPGFFIYVPFNEPDNNWYGYSGEKLQKFLADWKTAYLAIKSVSPQARIAGPNYEHFKPDTYRQFLAFARDNNVLPNEMTWHELHDDFFTNWYARYASYRQIEKELGIGPLPIVINEYAREKGDLAVPGNLIQWITRFETSGVDACLAFWTPSGTLSDLVARTWSNRPTGAWWLYEWYGQMLGQRLKVENAEENAIGLQALAAYDRKRKQARVLFGGKTGDLAIQIRGLEGLQELTSNVRVSLWRIDSSGIEPSAGPALVSQENRFVSSGELLLTVKNAVATSAYYAILSPAWDESSPLGPDSYQAVYANLSGDAVPMYDKHGAYVTGSGGATEFEIRTQKDGFYRLRLHSAHALTSKVPFILNGSQRALTLRPSLTSNDVALTLFLPAGINRVRFTAQRGVALRALDVSPANGPVMTLSGPSESSPARLTYRNAAAPESGAYYLIVTYANGELGHHGQVEDPADITVNNGERMRYYFKNTFGAEIFRTAVIPVVLRRGSNAVTIAGLVNSKLPQISQVQIAPKVDPDKNRVR